MEVMISDTEYEMQFKPFIHLKVLTCQNEKCANIFSLTETEILQLVSKSFRTYHLLLSRRCTVECPLCHTRQDLLAKDIIGDYLGISTK